MTVHTHKSNMRVYACVQTRYMYMQTHTKAYLGSRAYGIELVADLYCTISNGDYYGNNQ